MAEATGARTTGLLDAAVQTLADVSYNGGRVRTVQDQTPDTFAWAQNDTIFLARLPGDVVLDLGSIVKWEALGASVTMDIGVRPVTGAATVSFNTDPDAIVAGIAVTNAGEDFFVPVTAAGQKLWQYTSLTTEPAIMPEIEVYASLVDANPTDDAVVAWSLKYILD